MKATGWHRGKQDSDDWLNSHVSVSGALGLYNKQMKPASRSLLTTGKRQWRSRPLSEWGFVCEKDVRRTEIVRRTFCV